MSFVFQVVGRTLSTLRRRDLAVATPVTCHDDQFSPRSSVTTSASEKPLACVRGDLIGRGVRTSRLNSACKLKWSERRFASNSAAGTNLMRADWLLFAAELIGNPRAGLERSCDGGIALRPCNSIGRYRKSEHSQSRHRAPHPQTRSHPFCLPESAPPNPLPLGAFAPSREPTFSFSARIPQYVPAIRIEPLSSKRVASSLQVLLWRRASLLDCNSPVLEQMFLPVVERRSPDVVLLAKIRDADTPSKP